MSDLNKDQWEWIKQQWAIKQKAEGVAALITLGLVAVVGLVVGVAWLITGGW